MFSINDFKASINTNGILRSNKYIVSFSVPPYLKDLFPQSTLNLLSLRCENVAIPGFEFLSADGPPRMGYGPIEKNPYVPGFSGLSLTYIMDSKGLIYNFFETWCQQIVNFKGSGGNNFRTEYSYANGTKRSPYEVGYKLKYQSELTIDVYDGNGPDTSKSGKKIVSFKAYAAFPTGLPSIPLAWDSPDMIRLTVPFSYTDFDVKYFT